MITGIVVCVNFDDLLSITLPRNRQYFDRVVVISDSRDTRTHQVCSQFDNVELFKTDSFYTPPAVFNKGLAMEEGLDFAGRSGWVCIWDADILFPENMKLPPLQIGNLYCPYRRIVADTVNWDISIPFVNYPVKKEFEFPGYFQLFHAEDSVLVNKKNWYSVDWKHAGGCDSDFQQCWDHTNKIRLPFEVLHIGEDGQNWHGRATRRLDGIYNINQQDNLQMQNNCLATRHRNRNFNHEKI